jgi:hypothetical protein
MDDKERIKLREKTREAFRKYHINNSLTVQEYADNITDYIGNPFFQTIDDDTNSNVKAKWLKGVFFKENKLRQANLNYLKEYIEEAESIYSKWEEKNKNPKDASYSSEEFQNTLTANEIKENYFERLKKEFNQIRLDVVDFQMPIEYFIKIPLLKENYSLRKRLEELKKIKEKLKKNYDANESKIYGIESKIEEIEKVLNEKHDIIDIIGFGNDVFIEAPAGNGKSTLLRWLTYQFASKNGSYFPVFIELMYNTSSNLVAMIEEKLSDYDLDSRAYKNKKLLLLLDGFDQFTGNKTMLFKDIDRLKRKYKAQIVFSGRSVLNTSNHQVNLILYNLKELEKNDIKKIFLAYLGDEKGLFYYDFILNRGLIGYLSKPLYLTFLLAYISNELKENPLNTSDDIIPLIINRGKLLQSLIVKKFIKKYEKDDAIDTLEWEEQKQLQIELLSSLAYQMTFKLKNIEVIEKWDAEKLLKKQCKLDEKYQKIIPEKIIKKFLKHNILYLKNGLISFDKKELRLFFTSLFLKDSIKNYDTFLKQKKQLLKQPYSNDNVWNSIEMFLIGFMDADVIFHSFEEINFESPVILHKNLTDLYKLALEFINQKNYPIENSFINEAYLFKLNKMLIHKVIQARKDNTKYYWISWKTYLRKFIVTFKLFNSELIPLSLEKGINRRYLKNGLFGSPGDNINYLVSNLKKYDFKLSLEDLLEVINSIDKKFYNKKYFYRDLLYKSSMNKILKIEDQIKITYCYLFDKNSLKYKPFLDDKATRIKSFCSETLENYSSEFLNYFFQQKKEISPFTFKRYLHYIKNHRRVYYKFDSEKINSENTNKIVAFLKHKFLDFEDFESNNFYTCIHLMRTDFDVALRAPFCIFFNEVIRDSSYPKNKKILAFIYLFTAEREEDMEMLTILVKQRENYLRGFFLESLELYYFPNYGRKFRPYSDTYLELLCEILTNHNSYEISKKILLNTGYTSEKLNMIVLKLLQSNKDKLFLSQILLFIKTFDLIEAIPQLENLLKQKNESNIYYMLVTLDAKYHYTYKHQFKSQYNKIMSFLNKLKSGIINSFEGYEIIDALYLGDNKTLQLLKELTEDKYISTMVNSDTFFLKNIKDSLEKKCFRLNNH